MKILVYGVGAIGSLLVHYLCKAGNDVTVVARSTYSQLTQNGLEIRHYLQRKTTVDYPKIVKQAEDIHYDIVFSVMQGNQQIALLPTLAVLDTNLIVLVGNNLETDKCEEALHGKRVLYGFQDSAGHREGALAVVGRLPETVLTVGRLHSPATAAELRYVRKAFRNVKGYRIAAVNSMYAYYLYHIAEIMPYCYVCYRINCNLKTAKKRDIQMIMQATKECFDYLKSQGNAVMPQGEDSYYSGGIKTSAMYLLYRIMAKTVLGRLMVSDHCQNGIAEMQYLDEKFNDYRKQYPKSVMPTWDKLRKSALPVLQNKRNTEC
ncbi:MAG: ketopantoate reductase family protein [Oscillospiraceae bacterium]|nr:ketopantoate reductase family protein [Oscillospiraceae bacterium]